MALEHTFEQLLPQRPTCPFTAVSAAWAAPSTSGTSDITRKLNCRLPRQPRSPQQTARSRAIAPACRLRRDQREARSGRSYLKTAHQALGQPWPTTMMYVRLLPPPPRHTHSSRPLCAVHRQDVTVYRTHRAAQVVRAQSILAPVHGATYVLVWGEGAAAFTALHLSCTCCPQPAGVVRHTASAALPSALCGSYRHGRCAAWRAAFRCVGAWT